MANHRKIKGFTFIEVLMVFALVSILSLLLMPSIHTMKEKGRQATCIGNQRQLSVAAILYANESLSKLPLNLVSLDNPNYFPEYMKEESVDFSDNVYAQYTMSDFYNNNMYLTQCPEVVGTVTDPNPSYSYGMNVYVSGMRLDLIESASTTIIMTDSNYSAISTNDEVSFRHSDGIAIAAYVDGHVELFREIIAPSKFTPQSDSYEDEDNPAEGDGADPVVTTYPPVVDENGFEILLETIVDDDGADVSVDLTSTDDTDKALSHINFTFGADLPEDLLQQIADSANSTMGYPVQILNPDPQTGLIGIKFDETALGEDGSIETCLFNFYLPQEALGYMTAIEISVTTKAGQSNVTTTISLE